MLLRWRQFLAASLLCLCGPQPPSFADPLSDLINSPQMNKFQAGAGLDDLYGPRYLKQGSNFGSVFIDNDGFESLQQWASPLEAGFTGGAIGGYKSTEYVESSRIYQSEKASEIRVRILIPHPKFVPMLKYNLIKPFSEIQPPELDINNEENIDIRGDKARLFTHKDGACSLLINISKSGLIQLFQQECSGLHNLVTLAELLDIKRLERKLES